MASAYQPKLYLAGPEVFLPNAVEYADQQRVLCTQYGFRALHPLDNGLDLAVQATETLIRRYASFTPPQTDLRQCWTGLPSDAMRCAMQIFLGNIQYVQACDIVVANCRAFRGALVDDGTAYELGLANGLGKPTYGYIETALPAVQNVLKRYPCTLQPDGVPIDQDGYVVSEDFGTVLNLMLECGMLLSSGRLIEGSFTDCLRAVRHDLDTGKLVLPPRESEVSG